MLTLLWLACAPNPDCPSWYLDADGDGYGERFAVPVVSCRPVDLHTTNADDCADSDGSVHPGAVETCNGIDDNCDGVVDPDGKWFRDLDGDGFGDSTFGPVACGSFLPETGYAPLDQDCNDEDPTVHPGMRESCNGVDDNCDGAVDNNWDIGGSSALMWADEDGDGTGNPAVRAVRCSALPWGPVPPPTSNTAWVENFADCDDEDPAYACPEPPVGTGYDVALLEDRIEGPIDRFPLAASVVGDLDGDGRADFAIVSDAKDPMATLYLGGSSGPIAWGSGAAGSIEDLPVGTFIRGAGDTDGDGHADVLVAFGETLSLFRAPTVTLAPENADLSFEAYSVAWTEAAPTGAGGLWLVDADGGVWLFDATATGAVSPADAVATVAGANNFPTLERADLDGDGLDELILGDANAAYENVLGAGAVYVVPGPWSGTLPVADAATAMWVGEDAAVRAGQSLDASADADGDGRHDLAIGSTRWVAVTPAPSGEQLIAQSALWLATDMGLAAGEVALVARQDETVLAVSTISFTAGPAERGLVTVAAPPLAGTVSLSSQDHWYGYADDVPLLLASGDVDGDGASDLLIGAPGFLYLDVDRAGP